MGKRKSRRRFAPRLFARRFHVESTASVADVRTTIHMTLNNPQVFYRLEIDMDDDGSNRTTIDITTSHRYLTSSRRGNTKSAAFVDAELYHDYSTGKTVLSGAVFPHFFNYRNVAGVLSVLVLFSMLWCGLTASMVAGEGFVSESGDAAVLITWVFFVFFTVVVVTMGWLGVVKPLVDQHRLLQRIRAIAR